METLRKLENDGSFFAVIGVLHNNLVLTVVDSENVKVVFHYPVTTHFKSMKQFVNAMPKLFQNFKVVIFLPFYFRTCDYLNMAEFRNDVIEKLESINKAHWFLETEDFIVSYLIKTNLINVNIGETFIYIYSCELDNIGKRKYLRTSRGYVKVYDCLLSSCGSSTTICKTIIGRNEKIKIIFQRNKFQSPLTERLKNDILKGKNIVYCNGAEIYPKAIVDIGSCVLSNKLPKLDDICSRSLIRFGSELCGSLIPIELLRDSDLRNKEKIFYCTKFMEDTLYQVCHDKDVSIENLYKLPAIKQYDGKYVILTMGEQNLPFFCVRNKSNDKISELTILFNEFVKSKIPIIGFYENFSFIFIYNENEKCYKISDEWNEMFGKKLQTDEKKSKCDIKMVKEIKTEKCCVDNDMEKNMFMIPYIYNECLSWGLKFIKCPNDSNLMIFDTLDGIKTIDSSVLLTAFFLQNHFKFINYKTGKKHDIFGFWKNDNLKEDGKSRFESCLKEACDLIKIKFLFLNI